MSLTRDRDALALRQLREAVARGVRTTSIPRSGVTTIRATLLRLRSENDAAIHVAPLVDSACRRLLDAIVSDALRLAHVRDVDILLTFAASRARVA